MVGRSKGPVLFEFTFSFIGHSQYGYHWGTFSREEQTTWCQQRINLEPAITVFFILCCIYFARELDLHDHVILQALVAEPQNIHTHFQSRISWTCLFQPFIVRMIISFFEKDILGTYMADDAWNLCNYLMGCWLVKCFSFILYMLAWVGCRGKVLTGEQRAAYYASVCFVCRILGLVTGRRVPHGVWQRQAEWLADGHSAVSLSRSARC